MPNGEFRSVRNDAARLGHAVAVRVAQQRDAIGARHARAGASSSSISMTMPLMPLPSSGFGGALVSATSTSPLGSTIQPARMIEPVGERRDRDALVPAVGFAPSVHPVAGATFTVGTTVLRGCGQLRIRSHAGLDRQPGRLGATGP